MSITTYPWQKTNLLAVCNVFKVCFSVHQQAQLAPCAVPRDGVPTTARKLTLPTYLHCSGSSRGAGPDLEQPRRCRRCLAAFPRGSTLVHNQGLSTKHTHQMRRLFALHYSFLEKKKRAVSFKLLLKSSVRNTRNGLHSHPS